MNERKADVILATVLALTFAACAAGGAFYLRTLDSWGRQTEEKVGADAYINPGAPERADALGLPYQPVLSAPAMAGGLLVIGVALCVGVAPASIWVLPVYRRSFKSNPPRAPAFSF